MDETASGDGGRDQRRDDGLAALRAEVARLKRINEVLMDRSERDMTPQTTAFSLFRTAATLEEKVRLRTAELTEANHRLQAEIASRRAAEQALQQAKRGAEEANANKTRFLNAVSHDLHQPLNAARLMLEALDGQLDTRGARRMAHKITLALGSMESLLASLTDISRLEAGVIVPRLRHFNLRDLLANLANEHALLAQRKKLLLRQVRHDQVIHSDAELLERILRNLLGNAIRYTATGSVLLGCRRAAGRLRIEVWDTGPGIPREAQRRIFAEFCRMDDAQPGAEKGLGLGLAIAERIAGLLDTRIELRSWPGCGSVFSLSLPLGERARAAAERVMLQRAAGGGDAAGCHVLAVDNDAASREAIAALFTSWGYAVSTAAGPDEAWAALRRRPADVLIADYHLDAGADGLALIDSLRREGAVDCPTLLITADRGAVLREAAQQRGCRLLYKPLQPARLRALLMHFAERANPPPPGPCPAGALRAPQRRGCVP